MIAGVFANLPPLFGIPFKDILILLAAAIVLYWIVYRWENRR